MIKLKCQDIRLTTKILKEQTMTKSGLKPVFHKYSFICGIQRLLYMAYKACNLFEIHMSSINDYVPK